MFDLRIANNVARLTLNRPQARNAIPAASWAKLGDTAEAAVRGGARLLLVQGAGEAFCAGADLGDFAAMQSDAGAAARFRLAMRDGLDRLGALPIPTAALIEGA